MTLSAVKRNHIHYIKKHDVYIDVGNFIFCFKFAIVARELDNLDISPKGSNSMLPRNMNAVRP